MVVSTLPELEQRLADEYAVSVGDPEIHVTTDPENSREEGEWVVVGEQRETWDDQRVAVDYYEDGIDGDPDDKREFRQDDVTLAAVEETVTTLL